MHLPSLRIGSLQNTLHADSRTLMYPGCQAQLVRVLSRPYCLFGIDHVKLCWIDPIMDQNVQGKVKHRLACSQGVVALDLGVLGFFESLSSGTMLSVWSDACVLKDGSAGSSTGGVFFSFCPLWGGEDLQLVHACLLIIFRLVSRQPLHC